MSMSDRDGVDQLQVQSVANTDASFAVLPHVPLSGTALVVCCPFVKHAQLVPSQPSSMRSPLLSCAKQPQLPWPSSPQIGLPQLPRGDCVVPESGEVVPESAFVGGVPES